MSFALKSPAEAAAAWLTDAPPAQRSPQGKAAPLERIPRGGVVARVPQGNPHVAGNPVGGSAAFVGREDVLRVVVRTLAEPGNQGIVLYGQRRIGKTSILQHLVAALPDLTGHRPVYFDLQDKAAEALAAVLADLAADIADALGLPEPAPSTEVEAWFRDDWLPATLAGLPEGDALVLLFDEFDVLADVQAKQAASALFPYLRRLLAANAPRLRVVFVIGRNIEDLENVAHALFKGLPSCQVSLLSREDAGRLIRLSEENRTLTWNDGAVEAAWALTHGHPLLLQALCGQVWVRARDEQRGVVSVADVDAAVERVLSENRNAFEWLWKGLPAGKRVVAAALAQAGPRALSEEALHKVLSEHGVRVIIRELRDAPKMLIEWDLVEEPAPGQYQFRVELLRRMIARYKPLARAQEDLDKIEPTAELLYRAGEGFYRAGNLDSAKARLEEAIGLNPNHVGASELLADILISRKDWAGARAVLDRLHEDHPAVARSRLVQVLLAQAEGASGEEEQLELYQRVRKIERNPVAVEGIRGIWKRRGDRARAAGDLEAAAAAYRSGGLSELEAEIALELRKRGALAALEKVRELERRGAHREALVHVNEMAEKYGGVLDWQAERDRVRETAELADMYRRATEDAITMEESARLLAGIVWRRPDYGDAIKLLTRNLVGLAASTRKLDNAQREIKSDTSQPASELQATTNVSDGVDSYKLAELSRRLDAAIASGVLQFSSLSLAVAAYLADGRQASSVTVTLAGLGVVMMAFCVTAMFDPVSKVYGESVAERVTVATVIGTPLCIGLWIAIALRIRGARIKD